MPFRRIWTEDQDQALKYLRQDLNIHKWSIISEKLENQFGIFGRNQQQCRQKYHNHLDSSLNLQKLSPNEEKLLLTLHNRLGNRWAEISKNFHGRTDASLKNLFHSKIRKAIRKFNRYAKQIQNRAFRPFPLNLVCKIMENSYSQFRVYSNQTSFDLEVLRQLQNGLIEYSGSAVDSPMFRDWNEVRKFQYIMGLLEKTQQFYQHVSGIENDSLSDQSEYFPVKEKKLLNNKRSKLQTDDKQRVAWQEGIKEKEADSSEEKNTDEQPRESLFGEQQKFFPMRISTEAQLPQSQLLQPQHKEYCFQERLREVVQLQSNMSLRKVIQEISWSWETWTDSINETTDLLDWEDISLKSRSGEQFFDKIIQENAIEMFF